MYIQYVYQNVYTTDLQPNWIFSVINDKSSVQPIY